MVDRRWTWLAGLALAACSGPEKDTRVEDLHVIGVIAEPPEVMPGEATAVDAVVADPDGAGAVAAAWLCTPAGASCGEAGTPLDGRLVVGSVIDGHFTAELMVDAALEATEVPQAAQIWVLACAPRLCPVIDQLEAAAEAGSATGIETILATPTTWIDDLPIVGVSLGAKQIGVSTRPVGERNENPVLSMVGGLSVEPGKALTIAVTVDDDDGVSTVQGLATGGGFGAEEYELTGGGAQMIWYAPRDSGPVQLYALATDEVGGLGMWSGVATVR